MGGWTLDNLPVPPEHLLQALSLVRRASGSLWPGFDPAAIPNLVFDGRWTWLTGATPEEADWEATPHGWRWPGRHPALGANTAVTLPGGRVAAGVVLPTLERATPETLASILVHEAFHVYQAANPSPAWEADELEALTYPAGNAGVLHARAEETAGLGAALGKTDWQDAAVTALAWRAIRHQLLSGGQRAYERRTETMEGLAQFVESRFLNELPALDSHAAARLGVRRWAYLSGAAYAFLLARGADGWQEDVLRGTPLDELLAGRIGTSGHKPAATPALADAAAHAAQAHTLRLNRLRQEFDALAGQRLRLRSVNLRVVGFDPLNVHALPDGQILHARYVNVEAAAGRLEVMGAQALAEGDHLLTPSALTIVGVPEPQVSGGRWRVKHDRLRADFPVESVRVTANGWEINLN